MLNDSAKPQTVSEAALPGREGHAHRITGQDTRASAGLSVPQVGTQAFSAKIHRSIDAIAPLWQTFEAAGGATVYQRLDWMRHVETHLLKPGSEQVFIVEVLARPSGMPVLLLPLVLRTRRFHKVIEWLDLGVCDYAAPLLAPDHDCGPEAAEAIWSAVETVLPKADVVHVSRMAPTIGGRPNPLIGVRAVRRMELTSSGVEIDGDPRTVVERVCASSLRKELRRAARRMDSQGDVRFVHARTAGDIEAIFDVMVEQRLARFRELGRFDLLNQLDVRQFYRAAVKESSTGGPAQIFGISVAGEWIGTAYGLVHDRTFYGTILSMGGDWRRSMPGLVIISQIMRWCAENGVTYLDFTIGDMPYKTAFGVKSQPLFELIKARTLKGRLIASGWRAASDGKEWLKAHPQLFERMRGGMQAIRRLKQQIFRR